MMNILTVSTGEVKIGKHGDILHSSALGSCVAVTFYHYTQKTGAMAHVMLPGQAKEIEPEKTKYAIDAIDHASILFKKQGTDILETDACLVGGANVLEQDNSSIAQKNIDFLVELLSQRKIRIKAQAVGGNNRRSAKFDIAKGSIFFTEGNSETRLLWAAEQA